MLRVAVISTDLVSVTTFENVVIKPFSKLYCKKSIIVPTEKFFKSQMLKEIFFKLTLSTALPSVHIGNTFC